MWWKILLFLVLAYVLYFIITIIRFKQTGECSSSCSSCAHAEGCRARKPEADDAK
ncbi:MAG: FeoB-associated Cys-rich membrane protein [Firmicutes bacterium]|nr:FeoB-associated Cys-rich membrane protein [Bacillota bacterium]